ncbi:MAG: flippase-like domain-containing protein, partial [Myxococcota bacterium]|nr:flippase-like domain-containing protein [Myxococcota bacterium]
EMTLDAYGTVLLLRVLRNRVTVAQMLPVRIACEALHLSVPGGFVVSDTATAVLLEARCEVPLRDGLVASIARKWLVMRAHAAYIALAALVGFSALANLAIGPVAVGRLPWIVLVSAPVPLGASWMVGAGLLGRSTFATLHALLLRLPSRRLGSWLKARRTEAVTTDAQVARLHAAGPATAIATLAFLGCWCVEALETALLLRLVGIVIPLGAIMAVEAGLSLLRSIVVFAPSGLGVTDLGYATLLPMLGGAPATAAAFVLLKRTKELVWVMAGYAILSFLRGARGYRRLASRAI